MSRGLLLKLAGCLSGAAVAVGLAALIPGLSGCSKLRQLEEINNSKPAGTTGINYPHKRDFRISREHGDQFRQNPALCKTCHGENLDGGNTQVSCTQCHKQYPHSKDFKTKSIHGSMYLDSPKAGIACLRCHENDSKVFVPANSGKPTSCSACHTYPHESAWSKPQNHGGAFKKDQASCKTCHGSDLLGGAAKVSCNTCHTVYPHSDSFKTTSLHGSTFLGDKAACSSCHTSSDTSRESPVNATNCSQCHTYPHDTAWAAGVHGKKFSEKPQECKTCHGSDLTGGATKVSCNQCHGIYPHSEEFKNTDNPEIHGGAFLKDKNACIRCHNSKNEEAGSLASACNSCHDSFPHEEKWYSPSKHGQKFVKSEDDCLGCHGDSSILRNKLPDYFIACDSCHIKMPHSAAFKMGGDNHREFSADYKGKCTGCHTDYKRLMDKNTGDMGCFYCHDDETITSVTWKPAPSPSNKPLPVTKPLPVSSSVAVPSPGPAPSPSLSPWPVPVIIFPHSEEFKDVNNTPEVHGGAYLYKGSKCKNCHNKQAEEAGSKAKDCRSCHEKIFPHEADWVLDGKHGKVFEDKKGKCLDCHGEDSSFKKNFPDKFVACDKCHLKMPHSDGFKEGDDKHPELARPPEKKGRCTACHTDSKRLMPNYPDDGCMTCHDMPADYWSR